MGTLLIYLLCLICCATARKELECQIKNSTSFGEINGNITQCVFTHARYLPNTGKPLIFGENTSKFSYVPLLVTFQASHVEAMPSNIFYVFSRLEVLQMNNVGLRNFFPNSFVGADALLALQAYGNRMSTLNGYSFHGAKNLVNLDLSSNSLSSISAQAFDGLDQLTHLQLSFNRLSILDEKVFSPLKNLSWLWLDGNEIRIIGVNLLVNSQMLKYMNLNNNKISALSPVLFDKLMKLEFLHLIGNNCTNSEFINTRVASNSNIKKSLSNCFKEYRTVVPEEGEKFRLSGALDNAEKAKMQCETDKEALSGRLETAKQQLANQQSKKGK